MAVLTLDIDKLRLNYGFLKTLFKKHDIQWSIVTKVLCGYKPFIEELMGLGAEQFADSRISNLRLIKSINPDVETLYIKPPPKNSIRKVVKYADISLNSEIDTIKLLSQEAQLQNKAHKIIIMIDLGELREGILGDKVIDFYTKVFNLNNIEVIGLGTSLTCLNGVLPNHDKLVQLCLYKQLIEAKFNKTLKYISGGSSVTIPLIFQNMLPKGINHFRVGETLLLGTDVYNNKNLKDMQHDSIQLFAEIIELKEKPVVPMGEFGTNVSGVMHEAKIEDIGKTSYRAIVDIGLLDIDVNHFETDDKDLKYVGASSDMIVFDLGSNENNYKVGDSIELKIDYMGLLRLMNSNYVDKVLKKDFENRKK